MARRRSGIRRFPDTPEREPVPGETMFVISISITLDEAASLAGLMTHDGWPDTVRRQLADWGKWVMDWEALPAKAGK